MKKEMEASSSKVSDLVQELKRVKTELRYATDAELMSNKAMDDLVLALKEVATDCSVTKEKLMTVEMELEGARSECKEWKEKLMTVETELEGARSECKEWKEKHEESLVAWNGKESVFVNIIKRGEDEKKSLLDENNRLLVAAENLSKKAKEENHKVRDVLKQAISEANVARAENSNLKEALLDKEEELQYALKEIERVKYNENVANETVKKLLSEIEVAMEEEKQKDVQVVVVEKKAEEKESKKEHKEQNMAKKMIGKTCSFSIMKLAHNHYHNKHKEATVEEEANDDSCQGNTPASDSYLFKGSIFDVADAQTHHKRRSSCTFSEQVVTINPEDLEEGELSDNVAVAARKKKAFIRRFGDLLVRKK